MKAIILSAGKGERLRPLTEKMPKVMVPICGKPLLEHLILLCKSHGVNEVFLNLYYLPNVVIEYFQDKNLGIKVQWTVLKKLINASEAVLLFKKYLKNDDFFVIFGDVASKLNLSDLMKFHKQKQALATLVLHPSSHPEDSDLVELDDNNKVVNFHLKPHGQLDYKKIFMGNAGTVVFSPKIFKYIEKGWDPEDSISHSLLAKIVKLKECDVYGYVTNDYMKDIGTPERYDKVKGEFSNDCY